MAEETADWETAFWEKGFHFANTVLVSSTVSLAAVPRRARSAKVVAPARQPSSQLSASQPAAIRTLAASRKGCLLDWTRIVPSTDVALDWPRRLTGSRRMAINRL
jgi:hypothetical protein